MTTDNYLLPEDIHAYCRRVSLREPDILHQLREETARRDDASMFDMDPVLLMGEQI